MAPFRFRLEQVRLYRKQLEEQAMQALAEAVSLRDSLVAGREAIQREQAVQRERLARAETLTAAERWLIQSYSNALKEDLISVENRLDLAEEEVDRCRTELIQKSQDRELLDTLKEKQTARHRELERQKEQRDFDETATLRYKPAAF